MRKIAIALLGLALAAGLSTPALAQGPGDFQGGFYLGGGLTFIEIGTDFAGSDLDGQEGVGFQFDLGWRANPFISLDWALTMAAMDDALGYDVDYFAMTLGPKFSFMPIDQTGFTPWVMLGLGWHSVEWVDFADSMDGSGLTFAVGVDMRVAPFSVLQLSFRQHSWEGDYSGAIVIPNVENTTGEFTLNWLFYM